MQLMYLAKDGLKLIAPLGGGTKHRNKQTETLKLFTRTAVWLHSGYYSESRPSKIEKTLK